MPFLDETVEILNDRWVNSFNCIGGEKHAYGIAETILVAKEDNESGAMMRYPGVICNTGEVMQISINDQLAIQLYHKIDSITNGIDTKGGFGDEAGRNTEVANMSLIVTAFRNQVLKPAHWIEGILKSILPATMDFQAGQTSVVKPGTSSFDKLGLLAREFSEVELNYPEVIFFEMKYRIESTWKKGCIAPCI
ncbi:hypothetical protein [Segetibacter aerophilus]|uniref:Uncharacterized protein n=1 Tax=Segetibacter aerophilus TaxID=670293 RepID=A0A512B9Y3_9BACT|nr:hypothetical protein [Segetibacter aerophilus]GEO08774.1 hypothetical protein SAE01_12700 [Segetibacter aerophilus]